MKANIDHRYCLYTENFANKRFTKIMKSLWCYDYFVKGWSISLKKKESNKFVIFVCLETAFWQISKILIYGLFIGFNTFYVLMMWDKDPCGILETFYALKHMMNLVNPLNFFSGFFKNCWKLKQFISGRWVKIVLKFHVSAFSFLSEIDKWQLLQSLSFFQRVNWTPALCL